jgi:hypothetical protein
MWNCPKCHAEVEGDFEVCWQCGTSRTGVEDPGFVTADEAGPISDPIADHEAVLGGLPERPEVLSDDPGAALAVCYQANDLMEAKFIADQLLARGIFAISDNQEMQVGLGPWDGNPRVYCRTEDHEKAREWLEQYDARRASGEFQLED